MPMGSAKPSRSRLGSSPNSCERGGEQPIERGKKDRQVGEVACRHVVVGVVVPNCELDCRVRFILAVLPR